MAETGAAFAGEHSGHYYFRDNFCADSGIIAALLVLEQMSIQEMPLSQLREKFETYNSTGEINFTIGNPSGLLDFIANIFSDQQQDRLDGLTVSSEHWWFNLRPSNTEPLIRLNLETLDEPMLKKQLEVIKELIADFESSDAK
jgi:phosphomannomutase